jgi:hypothetical protein
MPPPNDVVVNPSVSEDFIVIEALELASPSKYDLIQWIRFSRRPMTLEELRYALGSDYTLMGPEETLPGIPRPIVEDDPSMLRLVEKYTRGLTKIVEKYTRGLTKIVENTRGD